MKMTIAFIITLICLACMYVRWEEHKEGRVTENSVLRDETDSQLTEISGDAIYKQYNLFGFTAKWNGSIFRYSTISDVSFNKVIEANLPSEDVWFGNVLGREGEIEDFRKEVFMPFERKGNTGSKQHSSVYLPIARELKRLSESKSDIRRLFIYSDLMENRPDFSFYNEDTFKLLRNHPEYIQKKFDEWLPLPSLTGIEVHLIYQPGNIATDTAFNTVSEFYGHMLEAKGAKVIIQPNLQN